MDKDMDVGMWCGSTPPVFVPISARAIAHFHLPDGIDGVMLLGDVENVIGSFPKDFLIGTHDEEEHPGTVIVASVSLELLH